MAIEKWNYSYVNLMQPNGQKYTITVLFYSSGEDVDRDFYRIMGDGFCPKNPASSQIFGFGYTLEAAIDRFLMSFDYVRQGLPVPARKPHPSEARRA